MLQIERDSWLLWNRACDTLNNTRQDLPEVVNIILLFLLLNILILFWSKYRFRVAVID
jgi:hypothetical protein